MAETAFEPSDGAAFAVALLNTWDELEPDPECLRDVGFVQRFLARHGLEDAARVARDDDLESLRRLRESLARAWDAANTIDHLEEREAPAFVLSIADATRSVRRLRRLAWRAQATVVPGHDPQHWPQFHLAPEYYA